MTKAEIKIKMQVGDYTTLGKMLGVNPDAARKQFEREKPAAIAGMITIITSREQIIETAQK